MRHTNVPPSPSKDVNAETFQRLLDAAGEVFAEKGFRAATVREICHRAGANVAAVNYHFGDKERLYEALLHYAHRHAGAQHAAVKGADAAADPVERLRSFVGSFVSHTLGRGRPAWQAKLLAREMIEPSPVLDSMVKSEIQPLFQALESICRELLGDGATDEEGRFAVRSVIGQCLHYRHSQPVIARLHPEDRYRPDFVRRLAEHITEFSLGGIERLNINRRRELAAPPSQQPESNP